MDNKKKKIYIAVICACTLLMVAILYFGLKSPTPDDINLGLIRQEVVTTNPTGNQAVQQSDLPTANVKPEYNAPAVFPNNPDLDSEVFSSNAFTNLRDYTPLTITPPEIGRDNPFQDF